MVGLVTANQFDLGRKLSNLGAGFSQGLQIANQFQAGKDRRAQSERTAESQRLGGQALQGQEGSLGELAAIDPQKANQIQSFLSSQSESERAESLRENDVLTRISLDALSLPTEQQRPFLQQKRAKAVADGRDTTNIDRALSGDDNALNQALTLQAREGLSIAKLAEQQFPSTSKQQRTASSRDFEEFQRLSKEDPEKALQFGRQAGFIRETVQEKADISVSSAERKEVAKSNTKRKQGFIDSGVDAADSVSNIKRSIALLDTVETGGFDNLALKAKQTFGVEGANEAELSANLGKNILAQLKPIFGAAFTASEGDKLERIEAGFGKSTEGNKRLLKQALKIVERAARRGIAAAEDQKDTFTANEIAEALSFEIEDFSATPAPSTITPALGGETKDIQEGQIIVNPNTGERLRLVNGQFVGVQ